MLSIQGTGRTKKIAFRRANGEIIKKAPDLLAARKHVINDKGWRKLQGVSNVFCFVSSPKIYKQDKLRRMSKGWCHALRNKNVLPQGIPEILLPESDFLNSDMVYYKKNSIEYDYFYFTINAKAGVDHKGLYEFLDILPVLCKHKLKGKIIVYFPNLGKHKRFLVKLKPHHYENLKTYAAYLDFHWGFLNEFQMNNVMTSCRFGLFPNTVDNSPRLISESLIRNVPILVNKKIHGGWHYVNRNTGTLFTKKNLDKSIDFILSNKFHAKECYETHYGFKRSSKKLADFLKTVFGYDNITHAYFSDFYKYLEAIND
jgi:hypothetical protein